MAHTPTYFRGLAGVAGAAALVCNFSLSPDALAQGCVAVRGGGMCMMPGHEASLTPEDAKLVQGDWLVSLSYRWLHSDRHFSGDEETRNAAGLTRKEAGTEVINDSHFFDLGIQYAITPRWSLGLIVPFVTSDRSSLYEHKGNNSGERYHTQAGGLGDVRLMAYAWILDPAKAPSWNIQLGLGVKAPTGDAEATDTFIKTTGPQVGLVDQSIQPGDGAWGMAAEIGAYWVFMPRASLYVQGSYLFNPEDAGAALNATGTRFLPIADQYFGRAGFSYTVLPKWGLSLSLGGRIEGVPVYDAFGETTAKEFRRPGFSIGIEPGLEIMKGRYFANVTAPVALYRNRERSVADKASGGHGDAAFADFVINLSFGARF